MDELARQKWEELRGFAEDDFGEANIKLFAIHTLQLTNGDEIQIGRRHQGEEVVGIFDVTNGYALYTLNAAGMVDRGRSLTRSEIVKAEIYS
jgi:hypothetical protein